MTIATDIITERVHRIVAKTLGLPEGHILNGQSLIHSDLNADSLDAIELVMAVEAEFGIEIADADAWELETVADIADFVRRVAAQQGVAL